MKNSCWNKFTEGFTNLSFLLSLKLINTNLLSFRFVLLKTQLYYIDIFLQKNNLEGINKRSNERRISKIT